LDAIFCARNDSDRSFIDEGVDTSMPFRSTAAIRGAVLAEFESSPIFSPLKATHERLRTTGRIEKNRFCAQMDSKPVV